MLKPKSTKGTQPNQDQMLLEGNPKLGSFDKMGSWGNYFGFSVAGDQDLSEEGEAAKEAKKPIRSYPVDKFVQDVPEDVLARCC